jgi:hypothetical protein
MGAVYRDLLRKMEMDKFRIFEKEYRLANWQNGSDRGAAVKSF